MRDLFTLVFWLVLSVALGLGLQVFYGILGGADDRRWVPVALFHSVLAGGLLLRHWRRFVQECRDFDWAWTFGPALAILLTSGLLIGLSRSLAPLSDSFDQTGFAAPSTWPLGLWSGLIFWVPLAEELVFRFGLSNFLRAKAKGGPWLGLYAGSIIFALAHGPGSLGLDQTVSLSLAIPLGPFLLALLCDLIYWRCRFIGGAILFHSACNATAFLFLAFDPRWLDWLKLLYLQA